MMQVGRVSEHVVNRCHPIEPMVVAEFGGCGRRVTWVMSKPKRVKENRTLIEPLALGYDGHACRQASRSEDRKALSRKINHVAEGL